MSKIFANHLNSLHSAREEFIKSEANERLRRALRRKVTAIEQHYEKGETVFYKKEGKPMWLGPAQVVAQDGKVIFIRHGGSLLRVTPNRLIKCNKSSSSKQDTNNPTQEEKNLTQDQNLTRSLASAQEEKNLTQDQNLTGSLTSTPTNSSTDIDRDTQNDETTNIQEEPPEITTDQRELRENLNPDQVNQEEQNAPRRSLRIFNQEQGWKEHDVYAIQIPRAQQNDNECLKAKKEELQKLQDFNVYTEIEYTGQTCISTRWVVMKKGENIKARLVARGFQEHEEIRVDSPTVGKSVTRIGLTIAASRQWEIKSMDIKSAFLQSDDLDRDVFLIPPKEAKTEGKIWKLNKCLYGLNDASRQFFISLSMELKKLGCKQSQMDHTLYYKNDTNGTLQGLILTHVDDFLYGSDPEFERNVVEPLSKRFIVGSQSKKDFKYVGLHITQNETYEICVDQNQYSDSIPMPSTHKNKIDLSSEEYTEFRSLVGAHQWLVSGTRPDIAFDTLLQSCKLKKATKEDLFMIGKTVKRAKIEVTNKFTDLGNPEEWKLIMYSDASFANLPDTVSSCFGFIILIMGSNQRCCPISWKANKIKRVCRSTLAAETMALVEGLEECLYLKNLLSEIGIFKQKNEIIGYTDNLGLREALYSTKLVDDKQTRIDIAALQQMLHTGKVQQIIWCSTKQQLANALTKRGASTEFLLNVLQTGRIQME